MNMDYSLSDRNGERGICLTCDDSAKCCFHMEGEDPVFFCEEYFCEPNPPKGEIPGDFQIPDHHDSRTSAVTTEKERDAYLGLCRTCLHLPTCAFLKPGGGTWACEEHAEKRDGQGE